MTDAELQRLRDRYDFVWATRRVLRQDEPITYMLRQKPNKLLPNSGWFFLSRKDEAGIESAEDIEMCSIERIVTRCPEVVPFLHLPPGSRLASESGGTFVVVQKGRR